MASVAGLPGQQDNRIWKVGSGIAIGIVIGIGLGGFTGIGGLWCCQMLSNCILLSLLFYM